MVNQLPRLLPPLNDSQQPHSAVTVPSPEVSNKCKLNGCNRKVKLLEQSLACPACQKIFCMMHRLPETHLCEKIENYKEILRKKHAEEMDPNASPKQKHHFETHKSHGNGAC